MSVVKRRRDHFDSTIEWKSPLIPAALRSSKQIASGLLLTLRSPGLTELTVAYTLSLYNAVTIYKKTRTECRRYWHRTVGRGKIACIVERSRGGKANLRFDSNSSLEAMFNNTNEIKWSLRDIFTRWRVLVD